MHIISSTFRYCRCVSLQSDGISRGVLRAKAILYKVHYCHADTVVVRLGTGLFDMYEVDELNDTNMRFSETLSDHIYSSRIPRRYLGIIKYMSSLGNCSMKVATLDSQGEVLAMT